MFGDIVHVTVGEGSAARVFTVHKNVLCFYSGYFENALKQHFIEGQSGHVNLPTENPDSSEAFRKWIYTRGAAANGSKNEIEGLSPRPCTRAAVKLWVFADAHTIPLLQNLAINAVHDKLIEYHEGNYGYFPGHDPTLLAYVYENTTSNAPLRRYFRTLFALTNPKRPFPDSFFIDVPQEVLVDIVKRTWILHRKVHTVEDLKRWDMCEFHVHGEGEHCAPADRFWATCG